MEGPVRSTERTSDHLLEQVPFHRLIWFPPNMEEHFGYFKKNQHLTMHINFY